MDRKMETVLKKRGLTRDAIKYIAMGTMLLNHIATIFLEPGTLLFEVFLNIGYFTAVTMCYFLVEGYGYTRSKRKYGQRLLVFAVVSQFPFDFAFTENGIWEFRGFNMIFTLFLCFLILVLRERVVNPAGRNLGITGLVFLSAMCDWAILAPVFTILFARAKGDRKKTGLAFGAAMALFGLMNFAGGLELFPMEVNVLYTAGSMAGIGISGLVILYLYNGRQAQRGRAFSKCFFYVFYPGHLLLLGALRLLGA